MIENDIVDPIYNISSIGKMLIYLRISKNISKAELARRLKVNRSLVSRDEKNEYYNATICKIERVLKALNTNIKIEVVDKNGK